MMHLEDTSYVIAATPMARLRGLLGASKSWGNNKRVLVLTPCKSIHTFGMRYPIDVAFADKQGKVLLSRRALPPRRHLSCRGAAFTLERPASQTPWPTEGQTLPLKLR